MKNYFGFTHASSFPLHEGQLFYWSIMTAVDSIKCRCAHSGMTGQVGGFQNPGVCLQAFPSFLPHPLSPFLLVPFFAQSLTLVPRSLLLVSFLLELSSKPTGLSAPSSSTLTLSSCDETLLSGHRGSSTPDEFNDLFWCLSVSSLASLFLLSGAG